MRWRQFVGGVLIVIWLGGCATGGDPGPGDNMKVGQREADLVAAKGQPQEVQPAPGGGKIYVYTTYSLDRVAAMGGGAWRKPDQMFYWLDDQGVITKVAHYPYGKRSFLFPSAEQPPPGAPAPAAREEAPAPPAERTALTAPTAPAPATPAPQPPARPPSKPAPTAAPSAPAAPAPTAQPTPKPAPTPRAAPAPAPKPAPTATAAAAAVPQGAAKASGEGATSPARGDMDAAARLDLNMSRQEVQRLLGPPARTEGFRLHGRGVIVWFYSLANRQGRRVDTPLVFEEGRLSGWGENFYQRRLREVSGQRP